MATAEKILTISVAAYNVEECLAKALESCVVPNMDMLEVIIVDDGSTDSTAQVARSYAARYPCTFQLISKKNGGYGSTVNASLSVATGKYFRYLDGDDWLDKSEFERYLNLLSLCDEDAVFTPYMRHYEENGSEEGINDLVDMPIGRIDLINRDLSKAIAGCALTYRTEFLRRIKFRMVEHCFYADIQFAYEPIAFAKNLFVADENFYRYRIGRNGQSVSPASIAKHYGDIIRVCTHVLSSLHDEIGDLKTGVTCAPYAFRFLSKEVATVYRFVCTAPPTAKIKSELMEFDALVARYPKVYAGSAECSKRVDLLRWSRFLLYRPICHLTIHKMKR